jgi:hypothetical protein
MLHSGLQDCEADQIAIHQYASYIALLQLSSCLPYVMAPSTTKKETASWTDCNITALVDYLHQHRAEAEGGNLKRPMFQGAVAYVKTFRTKGAPKDAENAKSKWMAVRSLFSPSDHI